MKSYWEDITPARAAELLRSDVPKRAVSERHMRGLARDMLAGRWKATPQGIILDHQGRLIDGWHRMSAINFTKMTLRVWVTQTETEAETKEISDILDIGRPRTFADRLAFENYANARNLAAIARRVYAWENGQLWAQSSVPTSEELEAIVEKHKDSLIEAAKVANSWKAEGSTVLSGALAGFCWWVLIKVDSDEATWFMNSLKTGAGLEAGSPVLALRERLRLIPEGQRVAKSNIPLTQQLRVWLVFRAWELFRERKSVSKMQLPKNPINNDNFPRPA